MKNVRDSLVVPLRVVAAAALASSGVAGCLGPDLESLPASVVADDGVGFVEDLATGRRCGATLVGPRVAVTAKTCLAGATADRLRFQLASDPLETATAEWQYYRGADGEAWAGTRFEDLQAILLPYGLYAPGLPTGYALTDSPHPFAAVAADGTNTPVADVAVTPDTLEASACGLGPGDPILQAGQLVAIVSYRTGDCAIVATTVQGRGPVESALSRAQGHAARTTQWHDVTDGAITARTEVTVLAEPARVLAAVQADWSRWWLDGTVSNRQTTSGGGMGFDLRPVWPMPMQVHVDMAPPESHAGGYYGAETIVIPVTLSGHFVGPARLEIEDVGTPEEPRVTVRSVWLGVRPTAALALVPGATAQMHMWAEGGKLPGRRTGFPGLIDYLERWQDAR